MDHSPSKRRKLSSNTSIFANDASNYRTQPIQDNDVLPRTQRQASFLSPTKASLARFNPNLLPRPKPAREGTQWSESASKIANKQHGEKTSRSSDGLNPVALRSKTPTSSPSRLATRLRASTTSPYRDSISLGREPFDTPKRRYRTPSRMSSVAKTLPISSAAIIPASPPRPAQESEEGAQTKVCEQLEFERQANAAHPLQSELAPRPQNGKQREMKDREPELPLTPTQLGLEVAPEPPKGLLYSSPSRRLERRNGSSVKSSPLKPPDPPLATFVHGPLGEEPAPLDELTEAKLRAVGAPEEFETIAKKRTLDQLLLQYQDLNNDVAQIEKEADQADVESQEPVDELISLITSSNPTRRHVQILEKLISISSRVAQFMPFSKTVTSRKTPNSIPLSPIPSHHPLQLEDPFPYLRVFTPLTIDSVSSLIPSSERSQPWLQHHDITFTSPGNLLRVELHLSVNAADESVSSLTLNSVSPWARSELGNWFNNQASAGDLPIIGWACGRYWEVAFLRARCWKHCQQRFPDLIPITLEPHKSTINADFDTVGRKRRVSPSDRDEIDSIAFEDIKNWHPPPSISDSDIRSQLGEQSILFSASGVSLLVSWCISFDWTGEIESCVSACASFPRAWQNADTRASLANIGDVFDRLLRDRGVFEAVRVTVALLYEQN
ncbi:hypothetical protein MMC18_005069 [Xylographa bjoerkii]|nr:hypothetical protein [Xylographa bjoerkii]